MKGVRIIKTKKAIIQFISDSTELMKILNIIADLELPECYLCAGTLRNGIWNQIAFNSFSVMSDLDVVYYDSESSYEKSLEIQQDLNTAYPQYDWEVKNQYYMHIHNPDASPYVSVEDAISKFPETATAIGARFLPVSNKIDLIAPHGVDDLLNFIVRPTPFTRVHSKRLKIFHDRVKDKHWQSTWTKIRCAE